MTTSTRVEDAKLRGMLTSCEGVTPGPWSRHDSLQETSVLIERRLAGYPGVQITDAGRAARSGVN